jgi:hypothetical protein
MYWDDLTWLASKSHKGLGKLDREKRETAGRAWGNWTERKEKQQEARKTER